ncbi:hypothetical protein [Thermosphaera sp.]
MPRICVEASWIEGLTLCFNYEDCVKVEKVLADFFKQAGTRVQLEAVVARQGERLLSSDEVVCENLNMRLNRVFKGG